MNAKQPLLSNVIRFPDGLLGFPDATAYRLRECAVAGVYWLLSDDGQGPDFLLSDPFAFFDGYAVELSEDQARRIRAEAASSVTVFAITIPGGEDESWFANLQGPVVINVDEMLGAQVVVSDPSAGLRRPFRPELPTAAA